LILQTEIQKYADERERVTDTNLALDQRVAELESISINNRARLATYMPSLLDEVAVLRDIEIIAQNAGVNYSEIQFNGEHTDDSDESRLADNDDLLVGQEFAVTIDGSYSRLKDFFSMLEQNEYPLQVYTLNVSVLEGGFLTAETTLVTYVTSVESEAE